MSCSLDWLVYMGACIQRAVEAGGERMSWDDWGDWGDHSDGGWSDDEYTRWPRRALYYTTVDEEKRMVVYGEEKHMVAQFRLDYPEKARAIEDRTRRAFGCCFCDLARHIGSSIHDPDSCFQSSAEQSIAWEIWLMATRESHLRTLEPSRDPGEIEFFLDVLQLLRCTSIECAMPHQRTSFFTTIGSRVAVNS